MYPAFASNGGSYPRRVTRTQKKKKRKIRIPAVLFSLSKNGLHIVTGAERVSTPHRTHFAQVVVAVCIVYFLFSFFTIVANPVVNANNPSAGPRGHFKVSAVFDTAAFFTNFRRQKKSYLRILLPNDAA